MQTAQHCFGFAELEVEPRSSWPGDKHSSNRTPPSPYDHVSVFKLDPILVACDEGVQVLLHTCGGQRIVVVSVLGSHFSVGSRSWAQTAGFAHQASWVISLASRNHILSKNFTLIYPRWYLTARRLISLLCGCLPLRGPGQELWLMTARLPPQQKSFLALSLHPFYGSLNFCAWNYSIFFIIYTLAPFLETRSHYVSLTDLDVLCRPSCPQTHRDAPASAFQELGLKVGTITPDQYSLWCKNVRRSYSPPFRLIFWAQYGILLLSHIIFYSKLHSKNCLRPTTIKMSNFSLMILSLVSAKVFCFLAFLENKSILKFLLHDETPWLNTTWGGKVSFSSQFRLTPFLKEVRELWAGTIEGTWEQRPKPRPWRGAARWLLPYSLLSLLSYTAQAHPPRSDTAHSELGHPTSIIKQK